MPTALDGFKPFKTLKILGYFSIILENLHANFRRNRLKTEKLNEYFRRI